MFHHLVITDIAKELNEPFLSMLYKKFELYEQKVFRVNPT